MLESASKKKWKNLYREQIRMGICYCYLCEKPITDQNDFSLEHVIPVSRNGLNTPGNWRPAHKACNNDKGALTYDEYRLYRQLLAKKHGKVK